MEVLVYSGQKNSRVRYAFRLIFHSILNCKVVFTDDEAEFISYQGVRINYSPKPNEEGVTFKPHELLFERDIFEQEIYPTKFRDEVVFFSVKNQDHFPFDPFAVSFYLAVRYEEYLPFIADTHNRFLAEESLAFKEGFLERPLINIYAKWITEEIQKKYPEFKPELNEYKFVNTVDVDNLYAYAGKGGFRIISGFIKDLFSFNIKEIRNRFSAVAGFRKDPYDTIDYQLALQERYQYESIYFMLFSKFGQYDRNLPMYSPKLQSACKVLNDFSKVGIHPSYKSNDRQQILEDEVKGLTKVLNFPVVDSRQHFLKLKFPKTFRTLYELGIRNEYSMGYASQPGFRASICTPYPFYDLELEEEIPLMMHPFAFMEFTFLSYQELSPERALTKMKTLIDTVKEYSGQMVSVWHNRTYSEKEPLWKGWNQCFEEMVKYASA